ncbi:hypothetical protein INR49_023274 [Caranx melampygus]|nr:hypothetical protein INR49_023274 [Caranx melampygus]
MRRSLLVAAATSAYQRAAFSDFLEIYEIWICFPAPPPPPHTHTPPPHDLLYHLDLGISICSFVTSCHLRDCECEVKALIMAKYQVSRRT